MALPIAEQSGLEGVPLAVAAENRRTIEHVGCPGLLQIQSFTGEVSRKRRAANDATVRLERAAAIQPEKVDHATRTTDGMSAVRVDDVVKAAVFEADRTLRRQIGRQTNALASALVIV